MRNVVSISRFPNFQKVDAKTETYYKSLLEVGLYMMMIIIIMICFIPFDTSMYKSLVTLLEE